MNDRMFDDLRLHGNTSWTAVALVQLTLCWAWQPVANLTDAFAAAADQCRRMGVVTLKSYTGMIDALVHHGDRLTVRLEATLHERMRSLGDAFWRVGGWVPIAFDGSRSTAPRSEANERALCAENYGKGKTAKYRRKRSKGLRRRRNDAHRAQPQEPQAWITLMWHMGLRLPWTWRLGPSNASERDHVKQMVETGDFPGDTLFCGDAGFVGYPLWSRIVGRGHDFLVRVGANVHLLGTAADGVLELRPDGQTVLCWPDEARRANRPPLRLRLLRVRVGKTDMWMLTSVLDPRRLPNDLVARLYKMRWGIEVEFRGLKQTLDRGRLHSRNPRRLLVELHWSLMAMTVAELFALKEQLAAERSASDPPPDPARRSLANTMRALRRALAHPERVPDEGRDLPTLLSKALTDDYQRRSPKAARYRPPNPDKKPLGVPQVRQPTDQEQANFDALAA